VIAEFFHYHFLIDPEKEVIRMPGHDYPRTRLYGRRDDMSVFRMIRHRADQFLMACDSGFGKMPLQSPDQVGRLLRRQVSAVLQVPGDFLEDLGGPFRSVLLWCLSEAQERVPEGRREENAGIQYGDQIAAGDFRQSELVVDAVCYGVARHLPDRFMSASVAFASVRDDIR
jgi:hypothetical protein